jgi:Acetyltransferases
MNEIKESSISIDNVNRMLAKDLLLNIDILECIRRGDIELIYSSENGVLVYDKPSKAYMMSAYTMKAAKEIIEKIPENIKIIVGHQNFYYNLLVNRFNFKDNMICYHSVYTKSRPIEIQNNNIEIRMLSEDHIDTIIKNYSKFDLCNREYIKGRINNGAMYGAFSGDRLCGFIGIHEEGSIGMLEVIPKYRGNGIAKCLQAFLTNEAIKCGRFAYGQITENNIPSIELQKKLGFEVSSGRVYWLFK